jgi:hypothetical protein
VSSSPPTVDYLVIAEAHPYQLRTLSAGAGLPMVVVADTVSRKLRAELLEAGVGFFDRVRGRLVLVGGGGPSVEVDVPSNPRRPAGQHSAPPIAGGAGITVALTLLIEPTGGLGVRAIARAGDFSAQAVSNALARLREASLVDKQGRPLLPELFWATAAVWRPDPVGLARRLPWTELAHLDLAPEGPFPNDLVELTRSGGDAGRFAGVAIRGTAAAAALGAPVAASGLTPLDLVVPAALVGAVARLGGPSSLVDRKASVCELVPLVTRLRRAGPRSKSVRPLVHPVVAALDLAQDEARGQEILAEWDRPLGATRVW